MLDRYTTGPLLLLSGQESVVEPFVSQSLSGGALSCQAGWWATPKCCLHFFMCVIMSHQVDRGEYDSSRR